MMVALPDGLAAACARAADPARPLRVAHAPAALQRMVSHLPLVIIIGATVFAHEVESIRHHAEAIGAHVLTESELTTGEALALQIQEAVRAAFSARAARGM
jgi:hypothetical protein